MPILFMQRQPSYPKVIIILRLLIMWGSIAYAGWFDFALTGIVKHFPDILLLSPTPNLQWIFQLFSSAIIIPYRGLGLSLVFDLLLLNFFLPPIYTFALSFLTEKRFLKFLLSLIIVGSITFYGLASWIQLPTPPCSLFSGLALAIVIFWSLLHRKGQSTLFLAFPISRTWAITLSLLITFYTPVSEREWARVGAILSMSLASYLWGIMRWRLRSNIDFLNSFEQWLETRYRNMTRFMQWYIFHFVRKLFRKL